MLSDEQWRNKERDERKREGVRALRMHARAKMPGRIVRRWKTEKPRSPRSLKRSPVDQLLIISRTRTVSFPAKRKRPAYRWEWQKNRQRAGTFDSWKFNGVSSVWKFNGDNCLKQYRRPFIAPLGNFSKNVFFNVWGILYEWDIDFVIIAVCWSMFFFWMVRMFWRLCRVFELD